nr:hypothetical protein [Tanacetum cinerariifolium]
MLREIGTLLLRVQQGNPQHALKYKGMIDSGFSRHMTVNKALLTDYQDINGGFVAFSGITKGGKITGKFDGKAKEGFLVGIQANKNEGHKVVNGDTGLKKNIDVGHTEQEKASTQQYIMFPLWSSISSSYRSSDDKAGDNTADDPAGK